MVIYLAVFRKFQINQKYIRTAWYFGTVCVRFKDLHVLNHRRSRGPRTDQLPVARYRRRTRWCSWVDSYRCLSLFFSHSTRTGTVAMVKSVNCGLDTVSLLKLSINAFLTDSLSFQCGFRIAFGCSSRGLSPDETTHILATGFLG